MLIRALIYARLSSSRLPSKVLRKINNETLLDIIIKKLKNLPFEISILTSFEESDDLLHEWCIGNNINCFRGSLDNVAERTAIFLKKNKCDAFFRINGDSPFIQVSLLIMAANIYNNFPKLDIVTNLIDRKFPYGISVELIKSETFLNQCSLFSNVEKEHITKYFYDNTDRFNIYSITNPINYSNYRYTIDTIDDYKQVLKMSKSYPNLFDLNLNELINNNINIL